MANNELLEGYNLLNSRYRDYAVLLTSECLLQWDMETKMPPGGVSLRGEQLAVLSRIDHKMAVDPEIGRLLDVVLRHNDYASLSELQRRNVYLIKRAYSENVALPEDLVAETSKHTVTCFDVWRRAKNAKDFSLFKANLSRMFDLKRRAALLLMEPKGVKTPYDAALDSFDPKITQATISRTFDSLKAMLSPIISRWSAESSKANIAALRAHVSAATQSSISKSLAKFIGYEIDSEKARGRIDETEHPFTTGFYDDVRITTHYTEDNFTSSLFSILHEGGHAMYEQSLPREWMFQPVGSACSFSLHESQSRFVENVIGRSPEFWSYYLPELKAIAPELAGLGYRDIVQAVNIVEPSKIRVEADEATYAMHIIIRFEIERDLFREKLRVDELPQVWNEKHSKYLGIDIKDDAEGVLQDVHWSQGYFGYFPSYAIGNIICGQLQAKLESDMPDWRNQVLKGDFMEVRGWLNRNVHSHGNLHDPIDLLRIITGEGIEPKHFADYLNSKYEIVYSI